MTLKHFMNENQCTEFPNEDNLKTERKIYAFKTF